MIKVLPNDYIFSIPSFFPLGLISFDVIECNYDNCALAFFSSRCGNFSKNLNQNNIVASKSNRVARMNANDRTVRN